MIKEIETIVIDTGKKINEISGKAQINYKGTSANLVTEADLMAETYLTVHLKKLVPDSKVLGEEGSSGEDLHSRKLWIIDPLDGTNNFAHTIPHFAVSVAYAEEGRVLSGVVYDPSRNECFSAVLNQGAYLNGKPIAVSKKEKIYDSMIATGFYYDRGNMMERTLISIHRLFKANIRGIRRFGSAALDICWVACGRFEGYFEYQLSPWDFAAGLLILKEAGGVFTDVDGVERGVHSKGTICSNGLIHHTFVELVKERDERWVQAD
ncbi:MAG TPA: inositol monophosphatase family protein [Chitinispirillaceae bacterium]|nr:inositol monophosphatase family protein [Chitinispirillaceae bacterium]